MEAAGGVGCESDRDVVDITAGRQKQAQHVMLTMGSIGRMWRALEELELDGLGIEHDGDIMAIAAASSPQYTLSLAIRR